MQQGCEPLTPTARAVLRALHVHVAARFTDGSSGVFRRGLVGVKTPHDLTDEQAYTAICNLFIS